jgi:ribosomal protein L37E
MKKCIKCSEPLKEESIFCPSCGTKQEEKKPAFCEKCGNSLEASSNFCQHCGASIIQEVNRIKVVNQNVIIQQSVGIQEIIKALSRREKLCAIFWIIVASFQALLVLINIIDILEYYYDRETLIFTLSLGVISVLNFIEGIKGLKFSKSLLNSCSDIMEQYESITPFITTLVWNSIIFIINFINFDGFWFFVMSCAVAVSVFELAGVRNYAINNKTEIKAYEADLKKMEVDTKN